MQALSNRHLLGARGTSAKVNATAGHEASGGVSSASVSDGSYERVSFHPKLEPPLRAQFVRAKVRGKLQQLNLCIRFCEHLNRRDRQEQPKVIGGQRLKTVAGIERGAFCHLLDIAAV